MHVYDVPVLLHCGAPGSFSLGPLKSSGSSCSGPENLLWLTVVFPLKLNTEKQKMVSHPPSGPDAFESAATGSASTATAFKRLWAAEQNVRPSMHHSISAGIHSTLQMVEMFLSIKVLIFPRWDSERWICRWRLLHLPRHASLPPPPHFPFSSSFPLRLFAELKCYSSSPAFTLATPSLLSSFNLFFFPPQAPAARRQQHVELVKYNHKINVSWS